MFFSPLRTRQIPICGRQSFSWSWWNVFIFILWMHVSTARSIKRPQLSLPILFQQALVHQSSPSSHPSASKSKFSCLRRFKLSSVPAQHPVRIWPLSQALRWPGALLSLAGQFWSFAKAPLGGPTEANRLPRYWKISGFQSDVPIFQTWNPHVQWLHHNFGLDTRFPKRQGAVEFIFELLDDAITWDHLTNRETFSGYSWRL